MAGKEWKYPKDYRKNDQHQTRNHSSYPSASSMYSFPSPYNFVPLSKKVFFPDWADRISHDIPFSDGICGVIDISVEAITPIYVRSGGVHPEKPEDRWNDPKTQDFFSVNEGGQYAIPGTSFKGMLRNVVEIASFGKMSRVDDHRYGVRDLNNPNRKLYIDHMTSGSKERGFQSKAKAGWLIREERHDDVEWYIQPAEYARVQTADLIELHPAKPHLSDQQRAYEKYDKWGKQNLNVTFSLDPKTTHNHDCPGCGPRGHKPRQLSLVYKMAKNLNIGSLQGVIVFTGQPSPYDPNASPKQRHRKHMEFIFFNESGSVISVPEKTRKEFVFIHSDQSSAHSKPQPNAEWAYWKKHLENGERVPVFYLEDSNGKLESMGLAMMFRLPYKNTIHKAIDNTSPDHLDEQRMDMAEAIFGKVSQQDGLRGRCSVTTLLAEGSPQAGRTVTKVLSSPKPTFYPSYIEQPQAGADGTIAGDYVTLMDKGCKLRGWKRYPTRKSGLGTATPGPEQRKVASSFSPLPPGTVFRGRIHVHNLRPSELGAIAWALSFGGRGNCFHSLGMAKPHGFGVVKVSVSGSQLTGNDGSSTDLGSAMEVFIKLMESEVSDAKGWASSAQIKSLLAMANPSNADPATLCYPVLEKTRNDFAQIKRDKRVLMPVIKP